jgi:hypothetical protein
MTADLPPHSGEAEQGVPGSMLNSRNVIAEVVEKISDSFFYIPAHRTIFAVLVEEWKAGRPADLITLTQVLRDRNLLDTVGGAQFVTSLFTFVPTPANVGYYLETVCDKATRRDAIKRAQATIASARDEAVEFVDGGSAAADHLPAIEDASALIAEEIDLPQPVVVGLFDRGAKAVLGGASKSFKTWLLSHLAVCVATGISWLGHETKKGRVLYINLEIQRAFFARRIKTVCEHLQAELESGTLDVWNLRGHAADLSNMLPHLLHRIGVDQYALIILDPVYKLLGPRDENKAGDIASLLNDVERMAVQSSAAVAFGAHYSKGAQSGKDPIDRIGGSGVFSRDPDTLLNFTKHEAQDCFTVEATLRNHPPVNPFVVRWEFPLMRRAEDLDPTQLKQAGAAVKKYHAQELSELLTRPMFTTELLAAAEEEIGMSRTTFYNLLRELKASGVIRKADGKLKRPSTGNEDDPF